ncbi:MAG: hypothetical protein Q9165_003805 [Trypethelium subeluteriae]
MAYLPSLIIFGSLGSWPTVGELAELRCDLLGQKPLNHVKEAIYKLPQFWDTLLDNDAGLEPIRGLAAAEQLVSWISRGELHTWNSPQGNILSIPLTILTHLRDYISYLQRTDKSHSAILEHATNSGGFQGFCAGLLSALAVAGSRDEEDIGVYGALSIHLAFAIGAYVDLDSVKNGPTSCLAIRWKSQIGLASVRKVLERHHSSYVSVIRDTNDATITVPSPDTSSVINSLSEQGISALDTGLTGRYHTTDHEEISEKVIQSCKQHGSICFGEQHVVRSNTSGEFFLHTDAVSTAVRDILLECSNWHSVISRSASGLVGSNDGSFALAIGSDAVPSSISRNLKVIRPSNAPKTKASQERATPQGYPANAVAIVGMSCKFPGADSPDEFWQLLISGVSRVEQVPTDRWPETLSTRGHSAKGRFWGNFMRGVDLFDHRFFKKSSREAASMDPQQRLLLQGAYEAMESAGYFHKPLAARVRDIGCYLGLCATDYDANVASHDPNAFSTLGTLRAFLSGKISHYFGWSGPSLTFDTACSSSAVAIHTACRALQAGECTQALAGGVALFTSPYLYENLSAAHFLSPTGATKPFDASADGYCRGEGVGLVVLKKLSDAVTEGDDILAVIGGSAVNQNDNCVPITVPNAPSQGNLYHKVAQQAGVLPHHVSFVESHGTGTPVGDPIEMDSIRTVFGGPRRDNQLIVSSVKGNIGHLEGASGVAGLIKAVLQIENRTAVIQASFQSLNPRIPSLGHDRITIPTSNLSLPEVFLSGCVNNYGAAGSNSAMMVMQPPRATELASDSTPPSKYPIHLAANSQASLAQYCRTLQDYCQRKSDKKNLLGSIAFHLSRRQDQNLSYFLATAVSDKQNLETEMARQLVDTTATISQRPARPALVLVFGGQVRDYVGLSKETWQQSALLRLHIDHCDQVLRSMGCPSLYPAIFQSKTITNFVTLHSAVFALQYASAKAWIDSDLAIDVLVGHSLGQLTALSVSGVLTLEEGLGFVVGRASLMKTHWGSEAGAMIAVEADLNTLSSMPHSLEIACYNGPSSHVLVGNETSVDEFQRVLLQKAIRFKRLQVTNGFHSKFTDPLIPPLEELASRLCFKEPTISIETCSEHSSWEVPTAELLAKHTRDPVFFGNAIHRLASSKGPCTWLEVGSDSGIIGMVRRALDSSDVPRHDFQSMSLSKVSALDSVVDSTIQLWKRGHSVQFWGFHRLQKGQYEKLRLPSYQWEKHRHWLDLLPPSRNSAAAIIQPPPIAELVQPPQLVTLVEQNSEAAIFKIDPRSEEYKQLVSGHVVAGSPLCPATLYMEMAARACQLLLAQESIPLLRFSELRIESPLGMATDRSLIMEFRPRREDSWEFQVTSQVKDQGQLTPVSHVLGKVALQRDIEAIERDFSHYERLTGSDIIEALYQDPNSEAVRGPMLYKMFSRVVDYGAPYRGLKSIVAKNHRIAGTVVSSPEFTNESSLTQPAIVDSWMQISGIHANSIYPCPENEVFVFTKLDRMQFGPGYALGADRKSLSGQSWIIFSNLQPSGTKELANDIFVFDAVSKRLVVLILGARFSNVRLSSLSKILSKVNDGANDGRHAPISGGKDHAPLSYDKSFNTSTSVPKPMMIETAAFDSHESIFNEVCGLFERVAEVPKDTVKGNMSVDDLGIDSLMMMEVISELSSHFSVHLPIEDMECLTNVDALVNYLRKKGCGSKESSIPSYGMATAPQSKDSSIKSTSTPPSSGDLMPANINAPQEVEQLVKLLQEHLELTSVPDPDSNLADLGLDSLLAIELTSDIEKLFSVTVDLFQLDETSTIRDLARLAGLSNRSTFETATPVSLDQDSAGKAPTAHHFYGEPRIEPPMPQTVPIAANMPNAHEAFGGVRFSFDGFSKQEGFTDFWRIVYPDQKRLVLSYTADAFKKLGGDLAAIPAGQKLPKLPILAKHEHLLERMHKILADGGYIDERKSGSDYTRTSKPLDLGAPQVMLTEIISKFPLHASEHRLLEVTASRLAECLTGKIDPLPLLFANKANRKLLADVYDLAPMCRATTRLLADFLVKAFPPNDKRETFHFLEVGGGTGGTTKFLVEYLTRCNVPFTYTFTDISSALVGAAKKELATYDCMRYATLDVEEPLRPDFAAKFHAIISTNCIHATRNAVTSLTNLRKMFRSDDGFLALVEFTNGLYWFDLVYGLLDGWWLFSDGRKHALADTSFWERSLLAAGYKETGWTDGSTPESQTLRLICGFNSATSNKEGTLSKRAGVPVETLVWKNIDGLELCADLYYPAETETTTSKKWPIGKWSPKSDLPPTEPGRLTFCLALLFHGGGHVVFTRKDIHMRHIKLLLERGFLPVSVDYRLCPEVNLAEGPMTDACDALAWATSTLSHLQRARADVQLDASRLAAVGWSAGGHLAMTLGYTAPAKGMVPPAAVLAFYPPTDFEAEFPVLVSGLPNKAKAKINDASTNDDLWKALSMPTVEKIQAVSPYAHIVQGHYRTPTFIVHGDRDELIPWQQSHDTIEALRQQGIEVGFVAPREAGHAFDLWPEEDPQGTGWAAMQEAYDFLRRLVL